MPQIAYQYVSDRRATKNSRNLRKNRDTATVGYIADGQIESVILEIEGSPAAAGPRIDLPYAELHDSDSI